CDNSQCVLHMTNPKWNDKPLPLDIDHKDGASFNSRPKNLWLLCPNCHAQQPTRGGANRGRIARTTGGYSRPDFENGLTVYNLIARSGSYAVTGREATLSVKRASPPDVGDTNIDANVPAGPEGVKQR